ncbi:hypothetical protein THASP1DRAFT_30727 [Thamnocephalis sphaerospora]|uniref:Thioredoxin domain-containing protein n=1 Tax=Thamnocephalis sphaerospora TaxID=78915 RepID=A0A4P9XQA5_9FUNG|nr:hypothetical protein THASP1DRAFT_30727 [Thamnocephalis sphaerospora]|eukprot:RKP07460.1 hypothetical protein THASP1DRAFT_30727 [Thamnocephalis sphaerospora]
MLLPHRWTTATAAAALSVALATTVSLSAQNADALYSSGSSVKLLNNGNFKRTVYNSNDVVVVEFFAPWCGHCKQLAPAYAKAAKKVRDSVVMAAVDCDAAENKQLCGQQGIQGFPTIKVYYPMQDKKKPGRLKKIPSDYQGERTSEALIQAAQSRLPTWSVTTLTADKTTVAKANIDEFLADEDKRRPAGLADGLPKAVFFTNKPQTAPQIRAMGLQFHGRLRIAVSRDPNLAKRFQVPSTPTLLVLPSGTSSADEAVIYDGELKRSKLIAFLEEHALPVGAGKKATAKKDKVKSAKTDAKTSDDRKNAKRSADSKIASDKTQREETTDASVIQIRSQEEIDACLDGENPCFMALFGLVDPLDGDALKEDMDNIEMLRKLQADDRRAGGPFRFAYLRGTDADQLAKQLDLADARPTAVIIRWQDRLYRPFGGAFDAQQLARFMRQTVSQRVSSLPLSQRPRFGPLPLQPSDRADDQGDDTKDTAEEENGDDEVDEEQTEHDEL